MQLSKSLILVIKVNISDFLNVWSICRYGQNQLILVSIYLCRMDEMMCSNKKWRELLRDDVQKTTGFDDEVYLMSGVNENETDAASKEVGTLYYRQTRVCSL